MGIEERFDISLIGALALREKQIQQNCRPTLLSISGSPGSPAPSQ
jgi:hypothetical protein